MVLFHHRLDAVVGQHCREEGERFDAVKLSVKAVAPYLRNDLHVGADWEGGDMLVDVVVLAQFYVGVIAERVHVYAHRALACHDLHLALVVHPIACHFPTIDVRLLSLAVVGFHEESPKELQPLALGEYAEVGCRFRSPQLGALHFQLSLALGTCASVRILVHRPSVSAVHASGLSVLQLKSVVVETFTERPLHLRSLDLP